MPVGFVVVVVEDDVAVRRLLTEVLSEQPGVHVVAVADGDQALALALAASVKPDLILLDLMLPGVHGAEVARRLRVEAAFAGVPIVAMSAAGSLRFALAEGFDDFLAKPFGVEDVERVVRRWLHRAGTAAGAG